MEEAQAVVGAAVLDVDEAEHAYAVLEDRAAALVAAGAEEGSAELLVVRHLQIEQVEAQRWRRARHAAAAERFREADARCAAVLRSAVVDGIADSLPYRVLVRGQRRRARRGDAGARRARRPRAAPVVAVADADGRGRRRRAAGGLRGGRCRGARAARAQLSGLGAFGGALRAGRHRRGASARRAGVVSTARLTAQQRLALGAVHEARARRDAARASFRVPRRAARRAPCSAARRLDVVRSARRAGRRRGGSPRAGPASRLPARARGVGAGTSTWRWREPRSRGARTESTGLPRRLAARRPPTGRGAADVPAGSRTVPRPSRCGADRCRREAGPSGDRGSAHRSGSGAAATG